MNIAQVEDFLVKSGKANPSLVVRIRADKAVPWDQVYQVADVCANNSIKVSFRPNRRGRDDRIQKKCLVGSMILHSVLGVTLLFGPAFLSHEPPGPPVLQVVPDSDHITDDATHGGSRAVQAPPPQPPPQPQPQAQMSRHFPCRGWQRRG